ncbi:MAG: hypothetical protein IPK60_08115 [Sandaracinaceae bacterium]|nr:hypothetical protein [Sandaracinaceae bacterium]
MELNPDFSDLLQAFADCEVEYLIVRGYAMAAHDLPRATKDLDVWIRCSLVNAERTHRALDAFGDPLARISVADLASPGLVFQLGVEPVRIDVLNEISGVDFETAWADRVESTYGQVPVHVISKQQLIANKLASGRPQDLADVAALRASKVTP